MNNNNTLLLYNSTTGLIYYTNTTSTDYNNIHKSTINSSNDNNNGIHDSDMSDSNTCLREGSSSMPGNNTNNINNMCDSGVQVLSDQAPWEGDDVTRSQPLHTPLSWWEIIIYRFRSFDAAYSPCRH